MGRDNGGGGNGGRADSSVSGADMDSNTKPSPKFENNPLNVHCSYFRTYDTL